MSSYQSKLISISFWMAGLFFVCTGFSSAHAQNMIFADPGDIKDIQSTFINPALVSYQESQVMFGSKVFHLGFLDDNSLAFKNGYFSASVPYIIRGKIGLNINGQYFNSPMYSQSNFSLSASQKFFSLFSIGLRANIFTKAYNRSLFELVDEADPVFANGTTKYAFSLGSGIFFTPLPNLHLSLAVEHLNRPNVALASSKYYQPNEISGGIRYGFTHFATSLFFRRTGSDIYPFFEIEPTVSEKWRLRLGYGMNAIRLAGQVELLQGFAFGYSYDYPVSQFHGVSFGSHQLRLTYFLEKRPGLPDKLELTNLELPFKMPENELWLEPRFEVHSSVTCLEIIEKHIFRKIEPDLTDDEILYLRNFELGELDSSANSIAGFFSTKSIGAYYPKINRVGNFTELYQSTLDTINSLMEQDPNLKTDIITMKQSGNRAVGLQNYLTKPADINQRQVDVVLPVYKSKLDSLFKTEKIQRSQLKEYDSLTVVNHESTTFYIFPIYIENYNQEWKLHIFNSQNQLVKQFHGHGDVPQMIQWDWKKDNSEFIEPELYYYSFRWINSYGQPRQSDPRIIDVRKIKRNLTVLVSKKPRLLKQKVNKIGLRLNR